MDDDERDRGVNDIDDLDITKCLFCSTEVEDKLGALFILMFIQFIFTTVVWAVIIGQKPGSSMTQLFTFFLSLFGTMILWTFLNGGMSQKKVLPWVGIFWLLHTFTTFIAILVHAIDKAFVDDLAGYIVMLVFCICFLSCWLQITLALTNFSNGSQQSQSVMNRGGGNAPPDVEMARQSSLARSVQLNRQGTQQMVIPPGMTAEEVRAMAALENMTD